MKFRFLRLFSGNFCTLCGTLTDPSDGDFCSACRAALPELELKTASEPIRALYRYDGVIRMGLRRFKYRNARDFGIVFGERLTELLPDIPDAIVTCVPRSAHAKSRNYNQSEVLARACAKKAGLAFDPHLLRKRDGISSQTDCKTVLQRKNNVRNAFLAGKSDRDLNGKTVILIDDTVTTGATVESCAATLHSLGAKTVLIRAVAQTLPNRRSPLRIHPDVRRFFLINHAAYKTLRLNAQSKQTIRNLGIDGSSDLPSDPPEPLTVTTRTEE